MSVSARIAVLVVGERSRDDDREGGAVLSRLRERAGVQPLPPSTVLSERTPDPGRLIRLWRDAVLAGVLESAPARLGHPGRSHRLELDAAALSRREATSSHGLGEDVESTRVLGRLPGRRVAYAVDGVDTSLGQALPEAVVAAAECVMRRVEDEKAARHRGAVTPDAAAGPRHDGAGRPLSASRGS
ncbi:peptidase M52 [Streptomyces bobili]|uniref:peptidase M52 n=1 Tax=Streptomyces bobili TaxID=67280 RepID=UPI003650EE53